MKLLVVFVHDEDAQDAAQALVAANFRFTMLNSTSGFLRGSSRTFLVGLEGERVEEALEVFRRHCESRRVGAPGSLLEGLPVIPGELGPRHTPITVTVGGVVGFLVDAQRVLNEG